MFRTRRTPDWDFRSWLNEHARGGIYKTGLAFEPASVDGHRSGSCYSVPFVGGAYNFQLFTDRHSLCGGPGFHTCGSVLTSHPANKFVLLPENCFRVLGRGVAWRLWRSTSRPIVRACGPCGPLVGSVEMGAPRRTRYCLRVHVRP